MGYVDKYKGEGENEYNVNGKKSALKRDVPKISQIRLYMPSASASKSASSSRVGSNSCKYPKSQFQAVTVAVARSHSHRIKYSQSQ